MSHLCSSVTRLSTTTCWRVSSSPIPHCHRPTSPTSAFVNQRALHLLPCAIHHTFLSQHLNSGGELSNEVHFRISSGSAWATFSHSHHSESFQRLLDCLSTKGREDWLYLFPHRCFFYPHKPFRWSTMAWRGGSSLTAKVRGPTTPCGSWRNTEEATKRSEVTGYDIAARSHKNPLWPFD